jgi:hypothetical protein
VKELGPGYKGSDWWEGKSFAQPGRQSLVSVFSLSYRWLFLDEYHFPDERLFLRR